MDCEIAFYIPVIIPVYRELNFEKFTLGVDQSFPATRPPSPLRSLRVVAISEPVCIDEIESNTKTFLRHFFLVRLYAVRSTYLLVKVQYFIRK